ncbi:unnamed protein product [Peronospora destructor]|uniref:Expansin-like EG45 domain-containing protein n=1 Tax=Peronospora destructor TaxID=86335 RepID=A0AAV0U0K2_9STRA|nr:unnamed protein product [Peronospora destructor]
MFRHFWLLATAVPVLVLADPAVDGYFTGDGTVSVVEKAAADACNAGIGDNYVAVNSDQWNVALNCGKCVELVCTDDRCSETSAPVTAYIVDQCTDCEDEGLDLPLELFKKVTGIDKPSAYTLDWKLVNCPTNGKNSFDTLKSSNSTTSYQAGTVEAPNESSSSVSIREENDKEVDTQQQGDASGTSPPLIALIGVLAAACIAALAVAAYFFMIKRKGNKKRDTFSTLDFDKFSSPAQTKATIVKM